MPALQPPHLRLLTLATLFTLASGAHAACTATATCTAPSQTQADTLFSHVELLYPSLFANGKSSSQSVNGSTAYLRSYGNTSLGTYQGSLWYQVNGGAWTRHLTLDEANRLYCNSGCWSSAKQPAFTMAQTLSDGAQRTTLAFSGLAMLTGNLGAQSFFPPGKVADYTGFQYLRDNDPDNMGHNTSFLTRVAYNVILTLSDDQFAQLQSLATRQASQISQYGYQRYPLMQAFRRLVDNDLPSSSSGLNLNAVKAASRSLYELDGQISYDRAVLYAKIINSFTSQQRAYLDAMKGKGWQSWPDVSQSQIAARMKQLPQGTAVAVMTYAGDLFSWYAGSLEADVYFCPERHGTYYGGFFIKDAPAVGHEGYSIDEQLTATAGMALSDSSKGYVSATQAQLMADLTTAQKDNLNAIVSTRTAIATLLRNLLNSPDSTTQAAIQSQVLSLSRTYGELDGANNHAYATAFAKVYASLSASQKTKLAGLRQSIMSGTYADGTAFDFSSASTRYLYSEPITDASVLTPYLADTDRFFFEA